VHAKLHANRMQWLIRICVIRCYVSVMWRPGMHRSQAPYQGSRLVDFFLFPRLKSIMKGARFADVAAIQERVTTVL
jgi:hypothetical protein